MAPHLDIDPNASPADSVDSVDGIDSNTTPDTEYSAPSSPFYEKKGYPNSHRLSARKKLEQLNQEEKVRRRPASVDGQLTRLTKPRSHS